MALNEEVSGSVKKQTKGKIGFYINLTCYLVVNIALILIWTLYYKVTDIMGLLAIVGGTLFGWGIGIIAHYISVFTGQTKSESK